MTIVLKSEPDFKLGGLMVSPTACRVSGTNGQRALQLRVMKVLVALARAGGDVVSREKLVDLAWDGVVVGEDAITRTISHLRRLSEWDEGRSFHLRTVATIGYVLEVTGGDRQDHAELLLAVLPFENLSDDPTLRFYAEGLSEGILQTIARSTSIRVIGRSSSFQFRSERKAVVNIGRELGASHLLDGAIQRIGERVRVSAQLVETAGQTMIWSDRFDYPNSAVFDLQDRLAENVAAELNRTFARIARPSNIEPDAYDLYLRGAEFARDITPDSQRQAVALLEATTQRAPNFAEAWGELALARAQAQFLRFEPSSDGRTEARARCQAEADRARALDPQCVAAKLIPFVGGSLFDFTDHRRGFAGPARQPTTTAAPDVSFGVQLLEVGRVVEALEYFRQADRFDPLFQIQIFYHSHALAAVGQLYPAIAKLDEAIARWPPIPFFAATRIYWAAMLEDWATVERLTSPDRLARYPLRHREDEVAAWVDVCRAGDASEAGFARLRRCAAAIGKSGLEPILLHGRRRGLSEALAFAEPLSEPLVDLRAPRRPDDLGPAALFLPFFEDVRCDPLFATLCARVGLVGYWTSSGCWPTCADEVSQVYDFREACGRAVTRQG